MILDGRFASEQDLLRFQNETEAVAASTIRTSCQFSKSASMIGCITTACGYSQEATLPKQ